MAVRRGPRQIRGIVTVHQPIPPPPPPPGTATAAAKPGRAAAASCAAPALRAAGPDLHRRPRRPHRDLLRRRPQADEPPSGHVQRAGPRPLPGPPLLPPGPGIDEKTSVEDIEHPVWRLTFRVGTYRLKCDVHPAIKTSFTVSTTAPPVPHCKVPKLIGRRLIPARRAIRAAHCSVGRVRYARSTRARGRVVSQSPRAGRTLAVGTKVNLVVSRGRR